MRPRGSARLDALALIVEGSGASWFQRPALTHPRHPLQHRPCAVAGEAATQGWTTHSPDIVASHLKPLNGRI